MLIKIDAATNLSYDANGNLQVDATYTYAYDEENRLTRVMRNSDAAVVGQYRYDALGRRGTYHNALFLRRRPHHRRTKAKRQHYCTGDLCVWQRYRRNLDDGPGGNTFYYHQNALWSVEAITDSTANPVERCSYDACGFLTVTDGSGNPIAQNPRGTPHSAIGNPWMFTGRQLDEETGLDYYRARYYDASKDRFYSGIHLGISLG